MGRHARYLGDMLMRYYFKKHDSVGTLIERIITSIVTRTSGLEQEYQLNFIQRSSNHRWSISKTTTELAKPWGLSLEELSLSQEGEKIVSSGSASSASGVKSPKRTSKDIFRSLFTTHVKPCLQRMASDGPPALP